MKYNDWITELKANLLGVSEAERRKVLDYYAEAYADRRAAGFSESEIIDGFGAPYDAAQAILECDTLEGKSAENSTRIDNSEQTLPPPPVAPKAQPAPPAPKKKRNGVAIAVCIIASFLILCLLCSLITIIVSCSDAPEFASAKYSQTSDNIQTIRIDFSVGEIETVFYDGDKIEIDYHTSNIYRIDISEKNGSLNFELSSKWWRMRWGVINYPKTIIRLPENGVYNLEVDMSAGAATLNGGNFGNLRIRMSAGSVKMKDNLVCKKLCVDLSAGKVDAESVECTSLDVDLSAGKVDIDRITCPLIDIDLSAGSVNLGVNGVKSEYTIRVDKSAGSCNVHNQTGSDASKKIDIDLSAGSVNVSFTN